MSSSTSLPTTNNTNNDTIDWNQIPGYSQFIVESYQYFESSFWSLKNYSFNDDFIRDVKICFNRISLFDVLLIVSLTFIWTFARLLATKHVFKPLASYYQIPQSDKEKMPESAWKFIFYLGTWTSMAYILLLTKRCPYFYEPTSVWKDYSIDESISTDIYLLYVIQLSFYLHSLYATLYIDQWRKDTPALMLHHVLCVILITISLSAKIHKSGILAMFLHDGCDVLLEGTKLTRYFRNQAGRIIPSFEIATNIGFSCFTIAWFVSRLYWFPLKQIYITTVYAKSINVQIPFILPISIMLWVLLLMNIYWFSFIIRLLYKVATGQVKELEDNREYEEQEITRQQANNKINDNDEKGNQKTRYFLRQRKIDYNLLNSGRSQ